MEYYLKAIKAALGAGRKILKVYNSNNFLIEKKSDDSPLTKADKDAHTEIMSFLMNTDIPILSEEGKEFPYEIRKNWKRFWLIDPLDGTKEFIKRNGEFTVNISLIQKGTPIFGVIYVPVTNILYVGIKNKGAYKFENISCIDPSIKDLKTFLDYGNDLPIAYERPFTVVTSRSHLDKKTKEYIDQLKTKNSNLISQEKGSSLKLCAIAEGSVDIYPRFAPTMEWDTAAGQAIIEAMGGNVTNSNGRKLIYNKKNLRNPWFIASK